MGLPPQDNNYGAQRYQLFNNSKGFSRYLSGFGTPEPMPQLTLGLCLILRLLNARTDDILPSLAEKLN